MSLLVPKLWDQDDDIPTKSSGGGCWYDTCSLVQFQTNHIFSPASFLSSRIGVDVEWGVVLVASGTKVYGIDITPNSGRKDTSTEWKPSRDDTEQLLHHWIPSYRLGVGGMDSIEHSSHRWEIQSLKMRRLSNHELQIVTVDGWGRAILSTATMTANDHRVDHEEKDNSYGQGESHGGQRTSLALHNTYTVAPISMEDGEQGWAGVDLDPWQLSRMAIARQFFRDLTIYDKDLATRQFALAYTPHAVHFVSLVSNQPPRSDWDNNNSTSDGCHLVACCQGSYLSIWDMRMGERGGRILDKCYGNGSLYAMDIAPDGNSIAIGGVDRIVSILDPRTWNVRDRWNHCLKYECKQLYFVGKEKDRIIAVGVDNELACGYVGGRRGVDQRFKRPRMMSGASLVSNRRIFGFRADSRWIGVTKQSANGYPHVVGMSEYGNLYWLRMKSIGNDDAYKENK